MSHFIFYVSLFLFPTKWYNCLNLVYRLFYRQHTIATYSSISRHILGIFMERTIYFTNLKPIKNLKNGCFHQLVHQLAEYKDLVIFTATTYNLNTCRMKSPRAQAKNNYFIWDALFICFLQAWYSECLNHALSICLFVKMRKKKVILS